MGSYDLRASDGLRLWSLLEMLEQFSALEFGAALVNLERATVALDLMVKPVLGEKGFQSRLIDQAPSQMLQALDELMTSCEKGKIPLTRAVVHMASDLRKRLKKGNATYEGAILAEHARLTRQAVLADISRHLFFCVDCSDDPGEFGRDDPWGEVVNRVFPDATRDICAASRCLMLREWTATVFHAMRVLEHGLRPMALRFDVSFEKDSWHAVLRGIEAKLDTLRNRPNRTQQDDGDISFYSDAVLQFRYFKDAWRNHVSHGRDHYDDREAQKVYGHVKDFMLHLASKAD